MADNIVKYSTSLLLFFISSFIFFLALISLGCSAESASDEDKVILVKDKTSFTGLNGDSSCPIVPMLKIYEDFLILGIKEANLSTENTSIKFTRNNTDEGTIKEKLNSEFGKDFLNNSCSISGSNFFVSDAYDGGQGAYSISYLSNEDALQASKVLEGLRRNHFRTNKFLTIFDWRIINNTILINFYDQALYRFYNQDSFE